MINRQHRITIVHGMACRSLPRATAIAGPILGEL
jgi:hypothetical protein